MGADVEHGFVPARMLLDEGDGSKDVPALSNIARAWPAANAESSSESADRTSKPTIGQRQAARPQGSARTPNITAAPEHFEGHVLADERERFGAAS
jgi:hypothetical protein